MKKKTKKKTNKEKNLEHDARVQARVRPALKDYNWQPLEAVLRTWHRVEPK